MRCAEASAGHFFKRVGETHLEAFVVLKNGCVSHFARYGTLGPAVEFPFLALSVCLSVCQSVAPRAVPYAHLARRSLGSTVAVGGRMSGNSGPFLFSKSLSRRCSCCCSFKECVIFVNFFSSCRHGSAYCTLTVFDESLSPCREKFAENRENIVVILITEQRKTKPGCACSVLQLRRYRGVWTRRRARALPSSHRMKRRRHPFRI